MWTPPRPTQRPGLVRICAWTLLPLWLGATAVAFGSVPDALRPSIGPLAIAFALAALAGVIVVVVVHLQPSAPRLVALVAALAFSLAWTWRDIEWIQEDGRNDGQAALVWLDPVMVVFAFPVALLLAVGLSSVLARLRSR